MSKPATPNSPGQRFRTVLVAALCLLVGDLAWGQAPNPALTRMVRPTPGTRSLGAVLTELARQGHLPLSYSSSLVPVAHVCTLRPGPARPLGVVLREVLAAEHLSYGLLDGQLVLWPARVAAPAGVTSVNSRPTRLAQSPAAHSNTSLVALSSAPKEAIVASPPAISRTPTSRPAVLAESRGPVVSAAVKAATAPGISQEFPAKAPLAKGSKNSATHAVRTDLASHSKSDKLPPHSLAVAKRLSAKSSGGTVADAPPRSAQLRARPDTKRQRTGPGGGLANSPAAATGSVNQPNQLRGPLASLPFARSTPAAAPASGGVVPVTVALIPARSSVVNLARGTEPAAKPFALASLVHPSYLHGEAWGSESLPLNAAVKVGIPRIYLVLGVAAGPLGHQSSGVAWGAGLGTSGRLRGRFTPSLDLVQWFVSGDRETISSSLTQLRPQVGWQLKQGGRWQLIGGPTLNLATAHREGPLARWPLGQDQWLWLQSEDEHSLLRLWPGVQLGLRF